MTTKQTKPITAAKVRAVLRKAGYPAPKPIPCGGVRNGRQWTIGPSVRETGTWGKGGLVVETNAYPKGSFLHAYAAAIRAAGIDASVNHVHGVVVVGKDAVRKSQEALARAGLGAR